MFQEEDRETGIVGRPLDPDVLRKMGALREFPPHPEGFRPDGDWTLRYRIFSCHGYIDTGNQAVGFLRLERKAGNPFQLKAHQHILHNNGQQILEVDMTCRPDRLASPVAWTVSSRHLDGDSQPVADLAYVTKGNNAKPGVTSDFSLMEAVQRLPFADPNLALFDVLEGMSVLRPAHRMAFDGGRRFHHAGRGLLPYQYWLDERHRLELVVTQWRAYILDDAAEKVLDQGRGRAARKQAKKGKK